MLAVNELLTEMIQDTDWLEWRSRSGHLPERTAGTRGLGDTQITS